MAKKIVKSKKICGIFALASAIILLVGCIRDDVKDKYKSLSLTDHQFTNSKTTAYNTLGFDYDAIPSGVNNIDKPSPTEFSVKLYVGDNKNCKVTYIASEDGKEGQETRTSSFKAYLSPRDDLVKVICVGEDSNIDYKVTAMANGVNYSRIGNLSYMAEASEF